MCVRLLIEKEADVNAKDDEGVGVLTWCIKMGRLSDVVGTLLEHGADAHERDAQGRTPLIWAARGPQCDIVEQLCCRDAQIDAEDESGIDALKTTVASFNASFKSLRRVSCVDMLLNLGADMNTKDRAGLDACDYAPKTRSKDIVDGLVRCGADRSRFEAMDMNEWPVFSESAVLDTYTLWQSLGTY